MKNLNMILKITFALVAYILSFTLLYYTPVYQEFVYALNSPVRALIVVNVINLVVIAVGYKKILLMVNIVCMVISTPSLLFHSKLIMRAFDFQPDHFMPDYVTAFIFLIIVILLMAARWLERLENQTNQMISDGALEDDVNLIRINSLKIYPAFFGLILILCVSLILLGFIAPNIIASKYILIIMAVTGITLIVGSVFYLYRKWVKK